MVKIKYDIGDCLEDRITKYRGIVMAITKYATGCIHYGVASTKLKSDGSLLDWEWFDQSRLDLIEEKQIDFDIEEDTSGSYPNPPQM